VKRTLVKRTLWLTALLSGVSVVLFSQNSADDDVILKAMRDEMDRSRRLAVQEKLPSAIRCEPTRQTGAVSAGARIGREARRIEVVAPHQERIP